MPSRSAGPRNKSARFSRRQFITAAGATAMSAATASMPFGFAAAQSEKGDLEAARKEGLRVLHGDQEADVVKFLNLFTEKTGIKAIQQRLLPGPALAKLDAEIKSGKCDIDVYNGGDVGMVEMLRQRDYLMRYASPELAAYEASDRSTEPGYWCTYFYNPMPLLYDTRKLPAADVPKKYADLLDPKWKGQIGFQNAAAGTQYAWWYILQDIVPADYWDKLAEIRPKAYSSSTQMASDIVAGNIKTGRTSLFQYAKLNRDKVPVGLAFLEEGTPTCNLVTCIIKSTKRPNAAKIFMDYFLSQEGQQAWNDIQGSPSARKDVKIDGVPDLSPHKLIYPKDLADFASAEKHKLFVAQWNKIIGF